MIEENTGKTPKLALCTHLTDSLDSSIALVDEHGIGGLDLAITKDSIQNLEDTVKKIRGLRHTPVEIRFHIYFNEEEIGDTDYEAADKSVKNLQEAIARISRVGGENATVHIGLNPGLHGQPSLEVAGKNLKKLVEFGANRGVAICVENLRRGFTSDPAAFVRLIKLSGARVSFDVGHAASSRAGLNGTPPEKFIGLIASGICNAHVYEAESDEDGHVAPKTLENIRPALDALAKTDCDWWVIELGKKEEIESTVSLIRDYLAESVTKQRVL